MASATEESRRRFSRFSLSSGSGAGEVAGRSSSESVSQQRTLSRQSQFAKQIKEGGTTCIFAGADELREEATRQVFEEYDVAVYYHETGIAQAIARSSRFQVGTLCVISVNTLWIGIEMDTNPRDNLFDSSPFFQTVELLFFTFFLVEWVVRFCAFEHKRDGLRDRWFCFDSFLVALMIVDTIVLPLALSGDSVDTDSEKDEGAGISQLSLLRMGRLLRLTRMVRFMRAVPELVSLMKSIRIALRPVMWTMILLFFMLYICGIVFRSQFTPKHPYLKERFNGLANIMWHLLLQGTFLDSIHKVGNYLLAESPLLAFVFILFVMATAMTLLNLLIGVLVDVMNTMASAEQEKATIFFIKAKLMGVLTDLDEDGSGTISREEMEKLMSVPRAVQALDDLGVDPTYLLALSEHIFNPAAMGSATQVVAAKAAASPTAERASCPEEEADAGGEASAAEECSEGAVRSEEGDEEEEYAMTFPDFINTVIRLRSKNLASVVDLVDVRKLILTIQQESEQQLEVIGATNQKLAKDIKRIYNHPFMKLVGSHPTLLSMRTMKATRGDITQSMDLQSMQQTEAQSASESCAPSMAAPCAPSMAAPCAPSLAEPCAPSMAEPCAPSMVEPCAPSMAYSTSTSAGRLNPEDDEDIVHEPRQGLSMYVSTDPGLMHEPRGSEESAASGLFGPKVQNLMGTWTCRQAGCCESDMDDVEYPVVDTQLALSQSALIMLEGDQGSVSPTASVSSGSRDWEAALEGQRV